MAHQPRSFSKETNECLETGENFRYQGDVERASSHSTSQHSIWSTPWWVVLCSSLLLVELQAALDNTMTANLQPTIINNLGEISKFPWINVTYALANGGSSFFWGNLIAIAGGKYILLLARLLFAIGCVLSGAAPSMNAFIIGKAIAGIGGGGTYIAVINILTTLTAIEKHGKYFGYIGFSWGIGTIIGPMIGGAFADTGAGWRWSFYFNAVIVGITFPVLLFLPQSSSVPATSKDFYSSIRRVDWIGSLLFAGALSSGIMALSFGGAIFAWDSGRIVGLFCCSGTLWILFGVQQITIIFTTKRDRVLPIHILTSLEMWFLITLTSSALSIMFLTIYYIPLYFQFVKGESAIRSAVELLPFLATIITAILISGHLITGIIWYKVWFVAGSALSLIMSVCLHRTNLDTQQNKVYGYLILGGTGTGLYAMNAGPLMSAIVDKEHAPDASTIFGCVDVICGAISVAVANSIFINRATHNIHMLLPNTPRAAVQQAIAGVGASLTSKLPQAQAQAVLKAILNAIKDVWIQMIATAALSLILSLSLRNERIGKRRKDEA